VSSAFLSDGGGWHVSGDRWRMTILIVSFIILGALLCLLVSADHQAADAVETSCVRVFENR
jgi:hypothetical protein